MTGTSTREDTITQRRFSRCEHRQKSHHHGQDQSSSSSLNQQRTPLQVFCAPTQHKNITFADFLTIPLIMYTLLYETLSA